MPTFSYVLCQECAGRGLIAAGEGVSAACPRCGGSGLSLRDEKGTQYLYAFPAWVKPGAAQLERVRRIGRYAGGTAVIAAFGALAFSQAAKSASLSQFLWSKGFPQFLLGATGLASMYALASFERHQTSARSLDSLPETSSAPIDLFAYSNPRLKGLLEHAAGIAALRNSEEICDFILLASLLEQPRIQVLLSRLELPIQEILSEAHTRIPPGHSTSLKRVTVCQEVRERFYQAFQTALASRFPYVDLEDMLLSYVRDPRQHAQFFKKLKITDADVYAVSRWYAEDQDRTRRWNFWKERGRSRPGGFMNRAWTALPTPFLDQYSSDITALAASGGVRSASARAKEIDRTLEVLGGTSQNSAILLGEPGVGKATVLGGIAMRMIEEAVPEILKDKRLVQLDAQTLLASEEAEANVQRVIEEVARAGNVILAIPDLHVLASDPNSAITPASLLANALAKGFLQIVSTATYAEYHKYVEQSPALASAVAVVEVAPATAEQALMILEEEAAGLESRYSVRLTFHALKAAVDLAEQYVTELASPSGALTLIGDAASIAQASGKRWVQREDVQIAVEKRTSVPIREADATEKTTLLNLEGELHKRVIGQDNAIAAVAGALRRSRAGLTDKKRPIASFLFVGPTGVGKTETAKAVADLFFGNHGHFIRFDMSEYQDATSVYRLIGAPTGSGEQGEGGTLTKAVREHPYSLLLFDEIEKADPHVLDLFLQLLDDGRLTENTGRTVRFQNCLIVATSNAGSKEIIKLMQEKINPTELPKQVLALLQASFRPEFLNRFDAIIPFSPLSQAEISQVVTMMLGEVTAKAAASGVSIQLDETAIAKIAQLGYDPLYGARPLRRVIQDKVESLIASQMLQPGFDKNAPLRITAEMIQ